MKITIDKAVLEMAIKKLHMLLLPVPAKETTAIMLAKRVSAQATEVCGLLQEALAAPQPQPKQEPAWWPAVENILDEYGLQAIDFVADFKAALAQPQQEPVDALDNPRPVGEITWGGCVSWNGSIPDYGTDLYTSPPARKALTVEQIKDEALYCGFIGSMEQLVIFVRRIEAAHGIKEMP